jgi:hypothetical protein
VKKTLRIGILLLALAAAVTLLSSCAEVGSPGPMRLRLINHGENPVVKVTLDGTEVLDEEGRSIVLQPSEYKDLIYDFVVPDGVKNSFVATDSEDATYEVLNDLERSVVCDFFIPETEPTTYDWAYLELTNNLSEAITIVALEYNTSDPVSAATLTTYLNDEDDETNPFELVDFSYIQLFGLPLNGIEPGESWEIAAYKVESGETTIYDGLPCYVYVYLEDSKTFVQLSGTVTLDTSNDAPTEKTAE